MRLQAAAALALALLASATAGAAAAPQAAVPSACPSLLTMLRAFPNSTLFADILQALGATYEPVTSEPPLPAPGSGNGTAQPAARRRLAQETAATTVAKPVACPAIYLPVCGTDNQTYGNECSALAMGATVACNGECPCTGTSPGGSLGGVCTDIVEPVCGADGRNYANSCFAQVAGVPVSCKSTCPCPDLISELERGGGGLLLVPTDEVLLPELDAVNATGIFEDDTAALKQLLARHVVLTAHQKGLGGAEPLPSESGTAVVTEAGQRLTLYSGANGAPGRIQTMVTPDVLDNYAILSQTAGCNVAALQIDGALAGLPSKAAS